MLVNVARRKVSTVGAVTRLILPCTYDCTTSNFSSKVKVAQHVPDNVPLLKSVGNSSAAALKVKTISKAMKAYLERARKHEGFLKLKNEEFELGKLHLANMMGLDASTLTQEDIDKAIAYLLPSGLYEPKARPLMKPPIQLFPREKAAQFDDSGRPFNPFFYTKMPNYFTCMHTLAKTYQELDDFEDKMIEKGILEPPAESAINMLGGEWLSIDEMRSIFLEKILEVQYDNLITTLTRVANHPYSFRCKEEIWRYRKELPDLVAQQVIPPLSYDEEGRPYTQARGFKKHANAKVTVRGNGTGKITINGLDIFYFSRLQDRECIMYPLHFCDMLGKVDVEAEVYGLGISSESAAVRLGLAYCLRSFVSPDFVEKMRIAGLLTPDNRRRGRKKPGQKGNRAKFTWKKR